MNNPLGFVVSRRPYPPQEMFELDGPDFVPCPELWSWIKQTFLDPDSPLFNEDHKHLMDYQYPKIAVMWAAGGFEQKGRMVIGQAEKVMINVGGWKKRRQEVQYEQWFGTQPEYLITLDAYYCSQANDADFCALIEHELYHIAQEKDEWGTPKFSQSTGLPKLKIHGHDVEEFIGVVRRYGASEDVKKMVEAANQRPEVAKSDIYHACGTCYLRVV